MLCIYTLEDYSYILVTVTLSTFYSTQSYYTKAKIPNPKHWCSDMHVCNEKMYVRWCAIKCLAVFCFLVFCSAQASGDFYCYINLTYMKHKSTNFTDDLCMHKYIEHLIVQILPEFFSTCNRTVRYLFVPPSPPGLQIGYLNLFVACNLLMLNLFVQLISF